VDNRDYTPVAATPPSPPLRRAIDQRPIDRP